MRCFVVGNGPSLADTNLDLLAGETTFGLNQCHLIYPHTTWRPTHWVCVDRDLQIPIDEWASLFLLHEEQGYRCHIAPRHFTRLQALGIPPDDLRRRFDILPLCMRHGVRVGHREWWPDSWHLPELCVFGGSGLTAIQLAVTMGYDEIYVVGMDVDYEPGKNNHFSEDYFNFRPYDPEWAQYLAEAQAYAHGLAWRECLGRGVTIANAGVGGKLEAYPRCELGSLVTARA